jgi:hypothetical protein
MLSICPSLRNLTLNNTQQAEEERVLLRLSIPLIWPCHDKQLDEEAKRQLDVIQA